MAKNWRLVHLQRSKGEAHRAGRAHIWDVFSSKGAERDEWRGRKGRAYSLAIVVL